mmetsp:Transcript_23101/g.37011  ORF Transcript_23101/g.37011 Transcript_23101/m.37011 type:complete len:344 (+) Transcript_23101:20-1051(+)
MESQVVRLFPRRKKGSAAPTSNARRSGSPLVLTRRDINNLVILNLSQAEAAGRLDVSITCLKKVCRKMGIARWPFSGRRSSFMARDGDTLSLEFALDSDNRTRMDSDSDFSSTKLTPRGTVNELPGLLSDDTTCIARLQAQPRVQPSTEDLEPVATPSYAFAPPPPPLPALVKGVSSEGKNLGMDVQEGNIACTEFLPFYPSHVPSCTGTVPHIAGDKDANMMRDVEGAIVMRNYSAPSFPFQSAQDQCKSYQGFLFKRHKLTGLLIEDESNHPGKAMDSEDISNDLNWLVCGTVSADSDRRDDLAAMSQNVSLTTTQHPDTWITAWMQLNAALQLQNTPQDS